MSETTRIDEIPLDGNPGIDRKLLAEAEAINRALEQHGLAARSSYGLAPALGGTVLPNAGRSMPATRMLHFRPVGRSA